MDILVYVDEGVSAEALRQTVKSLQKEIDPHAHQLVRTSAKQLISSDWEQRTALVVVPGGRDRYYHSSLNGKGSEKLRRFVEGGGSYLGLCAGAYFAAESIEFEKGGKLQVCAMRSMKLYPGAAIGPAYGLGKYCEESDRGVEAAHISWNGAECFAYFNGGCYFDRPNEYANVRVLSSYLNLDGCPAAIVECRVGKGKALLSGVHIEYNSALLKRDSDQIKRLLPLFKSAETRRRTIFREILQGFGININPL